MIEENLTLSGEDSLPVTTNLDVENPTRWSIDNPFLYEVVTHVKKGNTLLDTYNSTFGIRTLEFDANTGFQLNGEKIRFNGICLHHDLGPLGTAVNYRATERQIEIMKAMGANALRTSHNPPSDEMLEVCEAFDEWQKGKVPNGYNKYFDNWHERDLRDMIKRDRNHPSVILWSIGNEILEQGSKTGWKVAKMLSDICHDEDPSRLTTAGFNWYPANLKNKLAHQVDVVGFNYKPALYGEAKENHPDMIFYASETSSMTSSRGVYDLPLSGDLKMETNQITSYDITYGPPWAYPPDVEFDALEKHDFMLGEFIWTGIDYLGEPTPYGGMDNSTNGYWNDQWPSHASYFAPVDLCGFPKDRFYLYQSQWTTEPMVHVLPHWNWEGSEGKTIPVYAYSNCDEVELFVNGKSMGKKTKGLQTTPLPAAYREFPKGEYPSKYRLRWDVKYQPGSIKVVGYQDGKATAEKTIRTASQPTGLRLTTDRKEITADGKDLAFVTVEVIDVEGNFVPNQDFKVQFKVNGEGRFLAVGNGNSASLESFQKPEISTFSGKALLIVQASETSGDIDITASALGLKNSEITVATK